MKKIIMIITAAGLCLSAAGCGGGIISAPPDPKITGSYSADCTVTAYIIPPGESADSETEFTFSGHTRRLGGGFWEMTIDSPETVAGIEISAADDILTSRMGELTFDMQTASLPDSSPLTAFFSEMDEAAARLDAGNTLTSGEDGGWVYSGGNSTIIFDGSGYPVSMAVGEPKMTVEFTGFALSEGETSETAVSSETAAQQETSAQAETSAPETVTVTEAAETTASVTSAEPMENVTSEIQTTISSSAVTEEASSVQTSVISSVTSDTIAS